MEGEHRTEAALVKVLPQALEGTRVQSLDVNRLSVQPHHLAIDEGSRGVAGLVPTEHPAHGLRGAPRDGPEMDAPVKQRMDCLDGALRGPV